MRIALITSDPVFRLGFQALIEASDGLQVASDGAAAASWGFKDVERDRPDVLVLDVAGLGVRAPQATRELRRRTPETRVLVVTSWGRERDALEVLAAGGSGLVLKNDRADELVRAIRLAGEGRVYVPPAFRGFRALQVAGRQPLRPPAPVADVLGALSPREREVFHLVVRGWGSALCGKELGISIKTVDTHRARIQHKLGCPNALDLIRFAAENDLLRRSPDRRAPTRVVLLLVDDDARERARVLGDAIGNGWRPIEADTAPEAWRQLRACPISCLVDSTDGRAQPVLSELYRQLLRPGRAPAPPCVVTTLQSAGHTLAVRVAASLPVSSSLTALMTMFDPEQVACKPDMDAAGEHRKFPAGHGSDQSGNYPGGG